MLVGADKGELRLVHLTQSIVSGSDHGVTTESFYYDEQGRLVTVKTECSNSNEPSRANGTRRYEY